MYLIDDLRFECGAVDGWKIKCIAQLVHEVLHAYRLIVQIPIEPVFDHQMLVYFDVQLEG